MKTNDIDVVIVGGGHAGVEAALAVSRMGRKALIVTMDASQLALMSCNPAIGGIGKSHLVKEIDALGGVMGEAIDATGIQFRRLNLSRGAAVWSTRAQADRKAYNTYIVNKIAESPSVSVLESTVGEILTEQGRAVGIRTENGKTVLAQAVIITTGTFLGGLIHIGEKQIKAGRMGDKAAYQLSESFRSLQFEVSRLKTGTPPRLDGATIDFSRCEIQPGEEPIPYFSHRTIRGEFEQTPCYLTRTTAKTKQIVTANSHLSPIFSGQVTSTGPRYCPSIEDKYHRFADKDQHQIFLEPEGNGTADIYPSGFSTSLPQEVQDAAIRSITGLEETKITHYGYAVEYDYCPSHQITPTLETKRLPGLFFAGQINGTSGYEEAAAQGLMAGVNAVAMIEKLQPLVLGRSQAYIGVMIDDLCTRSTTEPYRMFTSRAEYRLALREDNARDRLSEMGSRYGLIPTQEHHDFEQIEAATKHEIDLLERTRVKVADLGEIASRFKRTENISLANLLRQPGVNLRQALPIIRQSESAFTADTEVLQRAAVRIQYSGYIEKQQREIDKYQRMEQTRIPADCDFSRITGLKTEAKEKFSRFMPSSLRQAGRIEGITAGDLAVLSIHLQKLSGGTK